MPPRERIVLVRSGRHLQVALDVLRRRYPGCQISVIATPNTDAARISAGIDDGDWLIFDAAAQFDAWPMVRSGLAARLWARRPTLVAVLWQDPSGQDRANIDRTALVLSPFGFEAITPDGTVIDRRTSATIRRQALNTLSSLLTAAVLGAALYVPAAIASAVSRRRSLESQ